MYYSQEFSQPFSVFLLWIARYRSAVYTFLCYMYRAGFIDWSTPLPPPQKGNKRHMSAAIKQLSMNIFQIIWQMHKSAESPVSWFVLNSYSWLNIFSNSFLMQSFNLQFLLFWGRFFVRVKFSCRYLHLNNFAFSKCNSSKKCL